jgi:hypothetical protein
MFSGRFTSNTAQEKIRQKPENPSPTYHRRILHTTKASTKKVNAAACWASALTTAWGHQIPTRNKNARNDKG